MISIRDKLEWIQTRRILLVCPDSGRILDRHLELNLIKRQAISSGADIALVTQNLSTRYNAGQLQIPVFDSITLAQSTEWLVDRRENIDLQRAGRLTYQEIMNKSPFKQNPDWLRYPVLRIISFALSMVSLLALGIVLIIRG
jgi:hypothetical protein